MPRRKRSIRISASPRSAPRRSARSCSARPRRWCGSAVVAVIASAAKQSMSPRAEAWIASSLALLAMTASLTADISGIDPWP
ncbi:hypothetical protein CWO90_42605 [Bradyrhizobium sp. Leo121]|nr:hypothetical protein CWO90_42605 [Bradyrhizobium sp. Leo121]